MKSALTMVFLIATLVALPICGYAEEIDWDKFVDHAQRIGSFGEWTTDTVTKDIWVGIPAGIKYTATEEIRLSADGTRVTGSEIWKTKDGRVLSVGSGVTFFDTKRKKIVRRISGLDMGKPYDGLAVLQEMGDSIVWLYTENSQGKTTRYRTVERVVDRNHIMSSIRRADGTGPTMSSVRRRVVRATNKTGGDLSSVTSSGPDVDLIKNMVESWRSGDIDRWRSYYSKDAKYRQNAWGKMAPIAELDALHRSFHKKLKGKPTIRKAIYEVITTKDGTKRAHLWFEAEVRFKSGEVVTNVVFASYGINDAGKITSDWAIYDSAGLPEDALDFKTK